MGIAPQRFLDLQSQAIHAAPHVRGNLIKILWHDGLGISLYAKRLEKGRFIWPSTADGLVGISASQLAYMLDGIDWRNPVHTFRPERAG
jgi:transposase